MHKIVGFSLFKPLSGQYSWDQSDKIETKASLKPVVDKQFGKSKFKAKNEMTSDCAERAATGREFKIQVPQEKVPSIQEQF